MEDQARYTHVAAKAFTLVDLFEERFSAGLDGPVQYQIHLASPVGPSTGGGKQVVQAIKLTPADGGPTIVIGVANTIKQTAELRSYALLTDQYAQRYKGAQIPINAGAYKQLLADVAIFFEAMKFSVTTVDATRSMRPPPAPAPTSSRGVIVAMAVSVGVLVVALWLVLSHLHN